jgi:hypothetical protein
MSQYISLFRNFSTFFPAVKHTVFVGRWSIPNKNTDIVINQIFDRNNEDHCGVCINNDSNLKKNIVEDEHNDEYYRPFFM